MKHIHVNMPDGSVWAVPATVVAEKRARFYAGIDKTTTYDEEYAYAMTNNDELLDWGTNNMNWEDVERFARKVETPESRKVDYQEGWVNGKKKVVET